MQSTVIDVEVAKELSQPTVKKTILRHLALIPEINYMKLKLFREMRLALNAPGTEWVKFGPSLFDLFSKSNCKLSLLDEGVKMMELLSAVNAAFSRAIEAKKPEPKPLESKPIRRRGRPPKEQAATLNE